MNGPSCGRGSRGSSRCSPLSEVIEDVSRAETFPGFLGSPLLEGAVRWYCFDFASGIVGSYPY